MFYVGRKVQINMGSFRGYEAFITGESGNKRWTVRFIHSGGYRVYAQRDLIAL